MKSALLCVLLSGAVLAQTATKSTSASTTATKSTSAAKSTAVAKQYVPPPGPAADLLHPASLLRTAPPTFRVRLTTTKGDVIVEVTRAWAPRGADHFYSLVRAGYYTDAPFYRVMPKFMAQFGVSARPDVNAAFRNQNFQDDPHTGHSNKRGTVTFATTSAPNSRGTALFINLVDNNYLDSGFLPIGEVVEGMENVDNLYNGYGDTSPRQFDFENGGKAFTDKNFPKLDRILSAATIAVMPVPGAAATPAAPKQ